MPNGADLLDDFTSQKGDIVLAERSTLSAFMQTDLHEQLKTAEVEHLLIVGPCANLTLDSTIRDGVQFGDHITLLQDCAVAESPAETQDTLQVTLPRYAQTVLDLERFEALLQK